MTQSNKYRLPLKTDLTFYFHEFDNIHDVIKMNNQCIDFGEGEGECTHQMVYTNRFGNWYLTEINHNHIRQLYKSQKILLTKIEKDHFQIKTEFFENDFIEDNDLIFKDLVEF